MKKLIYALFLFFLLSFASAQSSAIVVIAAKNAGGAADGLIGNTGTDASYIARYNDTIYHYKQQPTTAGNVRYARTTVVNANGNAIDICLATVNGGGNDPIVLCCTATAASDDHQTICCDAGSTYEVLDSTDYYIGIDMTNDEASNIISTPASGQGYFDATSATDACLRSDFIGEATSSGDETNTYWNNTPC